MLYMDGTLDEEDLAMIFDQLEVAGNSPLQISFSCRGLFLNVSLPKSDRRPVSRLRYTSRITVHADYNQANKLVFVLVR